MNRRNFFGTIEGLVISSMVVLIAGLLSVTAQATTFPDKPVRIVMGFPAGGPLDQHIRLLSTRLTASLGQPVVIDYRAGAGGTIGAQFVAQSPPDGYTLLLANTGTMVINPAIYTQKPYDPLRDFVPVARTDQPDQQEVAQRRQRRWEPYHTQIAAELVRIRTQHGVAALWDAHSIRSRVPRFFEGRLPDLNLGTADGVSCDPRLAATLLDIGQKAEGYTAVLNGRFKGGHITRHFGAPLQGIHAIQLEMAQSVYMQEAYPFEYQPLLAAKIQPHLRSMLEATLNFVESF